MSEPAWIVHRSIDAMAEAVTTQVDAVVREAIAARGRCLLALPGGRSPAPIFSRLSACPAEWTRVTIVPTDERLVAKTHALSNASLLARHFADAGARVVPLVADADADYRAAGVAADAVLRTLPWPPDLVWLGMGGDGHTASIFPGPDLLAALEGPSTRRAVGVLPDPLPAEAPVPRVTLTRAAIRSARHLLLTLSGDDKRRIAERALDGLHSSDSPIGRVLRQAPMPVDIHWSPA